MVQYTDSLALWVIMYASNLTCLEDSNEEYVVLHISFASFVITDFNN